MTANPDLAELAAADPRIAEIVKAQNAVVRNSSITYLLTRLAEVTADRDMWIADDAKQNNSLGRVIAERDQLREQLKELQNAECIECNEIFRIDSLTDERGRLLLCDAASRTHGLGLA